jgi:hypothetical protein
MILPSQIRRMNEVKEASAAKMAAGLRGMAGRRLAPEPEPEPEEDLGPREPLSAVGFRSIPEPFKRRYRADDECRVSLPFVSLQHEELR